ncbi:ATP synthase subunit I [soil metagenome]
MPMNDILRLTLALLAGAALGTVFFGGLLWTVRRGVTSEQPALWFLGSMLLRMGVALAGFYVVADGRWERLVSCLAGFVLARVVVMRCSRSGENLATREAKYAP